MSGDKLLHSPEESAELLGVGRSYMFELIARGEIESFKVGRLRKIPAQSLTDFVERQRAAAQAPQSA